jgi:hypothetical protein
LLRDWFFLVSESESVFFKYMKQQQNFVLGDMNLY